MPFIETKTSVAVSKEQLVALKEAFAKAIEIIPGKSEQWLMLNTIGECNMAFRGDMDAPCAMIKVEIFGNLFLIKQVADISAVSLVPAEAVHIGSCITHFFYKWRFKNVFHD